MILKTKLVRSLFLSTRIANFSTQEKLLKIDEEFNMNYLKVGSGSHAVLCSPGALGSIWTDFKPQIEMFDQDKLTLVAWDPPGYGKSRPPERNFTMDFYERDAEYAYQLMKALGIPKYSLMGWSDGGITSLILAAKHTNQVSKLVVWGANSYILPHELEAYKKTKDIKSWSPRMREPMIKLYGEKLFAEYWARWLSTMESIYKTRDGDICSKVLKLIECPTLILHGEKDPMVDNVHVSHLHTHIIGSRIHLYPEGKHNIHLRYPEDFNTKVQEFLLS